MKKLFLLFIVAAAVVACRDTKPKNELGLTGEVESVKEYRYEVEERFGEVECGDLIGAEITKFNSDGYVIESAIYYDDGEIAGKTKNTYNGDVLTKQEFFLFGKLIGTTYNRKIQMLGV